MASRSDIINVKDLLFRCNNGIDVFQKELNLTKKSNNLVCCCPFHNEKTPSFTIKPSGKFKCYGCGLEGYIFDFLMLKYGIDYRQALERVKNDYPVQIAKNVVKIQHKVHITELMFEFTDIPFTDAAKKYWEQYELDEQFLRENNVFQVGKLKIGENIQYLKSNWIRFAYWDRMTDKVKILTLGEGVPKDKKWRTNAPNNLLWFYNDYVSSKVDNLFVCKSVKDALVIKKLGYNAIAVQSEGSKIMLQYNVNKINDIANNVFITFGTDEQGKNASIEITKETGWSYFNTENYLLKQGINDPAELVKDYSGVILRNQIEKKLKNYEKSKKLSSIL
jgi:CHC2 zinc finger